MAWKDTQMFSSNLFTESAASDKMHLVISLFLSSVFRMLMLRTLVFLEPSPCHVLFSDSVAHSHDNALNIRTLGLRERGCGISSKSQISLVEGNLAEVNQGLESTWHLS